MPLTNQAKDDLGDLMFLNVAAVNYGDAAGLLASAAAGNTELALSTGTLTAADTLMTATEVAYTGYLRPTQARSGAGWTSVNGAIANAALEQFGEMTAGGPDTVTDFALTFEATTDFLQWFGALDASLIINDGVNPQFAIGALDLTIT